MQAQLVAFLQATYGSDVCYAVIVGSHVYGTATSSSDIDLIVVLKSRQPSVDTVREIHVQLGPIDISEYSEIQFIQDIARSWPYAMESLFLPKEFILIGGPSVYLNHFKWSPPLIRTAFGEICRNSWNRGIKKFTKETSNKEHYIGGKCLYHALRNFHFAIQLYKNKHIDFTDPELVRIKDFYLSIRNLPVTELATGGKLLPTYIELYKQWNKQFRQIPNEEQYRQMLKRQ